jgi:anthranilate synthase component 1
MYRPSLEEFQELAKTSNLVPVYREVLADLDTPVSAYLKLGTQPYSYLLESVERGERLGRYSFLGLDPFLVFEVDTRGQATFTYRDGTTSKHEPAKDPLSLLEEKMKAFQAATPPSLPMFFGGAVGYVGYDAVKWWENLPQEERESLNLPHVVFSIASTVLIFDHLDHKLKIVSYAFLDGSSSKRIYDEAVERIDAVVEKLYKAPPLPRNLTPTRSSPEPITSNLTKGQFVTGVRKAKEYITQGDIFQVVLSQRLSRRTSAAPFDLYRILRSLNPSPYMYYLHCGEFSVVGSSPEILVRKEGEEVILRPIAGTRPRGRTEEEDGHLAEELLQDEKERAEHIMLVDLGRNDVGRVCRYGTVRVKELYAIERYSHVMHLVSEVRGKLRSGIGAFDLFRACFPAGTVSGAPKVRAMEIIEELEPSHRGPYAGALGYFSFSGNMDTCITIRTMIVRDGTAYIQAGGGIVADSDPDREYTESMNKAKALIRTIDLAEEGGEWL